MFCKINLIAQSSFELTGLWGFRSESTSLLNSYESNPSNYSLLKDWGLTLSYGGEFSDEVNSNIYLLSLSKKISDHFVSIRYTPGYQKDFIFSTGEAIIFEDSTIQNLNSQFSYKELFGAGYSYKFFDNIGAGLSIRYFKQEFKTESFLPVFGTTNYIVRDSETETDNFWKTDFGINYFPLGNIMLSASSVNLFILSEGNLSEENKPYSLNKDKAVQFGFSYYPLSDFEINFSFETNNSFQVGLNTYLNIWDNNMNIAATVFHDDFQTPYIAGIIPAISFSNSLFGVSLSGVKYFSDRKKKQSFNSFTENGLNNIINNRYSFDKVILTLSFTLNTVKLRPVELIDIEVINEIYPTLTGFYLDTPFAVGKVVNLTDELVSVRPYSRIEGVNSEKIQSPEVFISGRDTVEVQFFTLIPDMFIKSKPEISYADFSVSVSNDESEEQFQKAVLVNGSNSWDGIVYNLKYFIKRDLNLSLNYAKEILSNYKTLLDTLGANLSDFYKTKIIFNEVVKNLVYISDPRASAEYVQFPNETIKLKGGDCDDLSVLFSSIFESVGIETALVDYKVDEGIRHVNLLVNTKLNPEEGSLVTKNDTKYFLRKTEKGEDKIWIPVEVTSLNDFNIAWNKGAEKFNKEALQEFGLIKGTVEIIDIY